MMDYMYCPTPIERLWIFTKINHENLTCNRIRLVQNLKKMQVLLFHGYRYFNLYSSLMPSSCPGVSLKAEQLDKLISFEDDFMWLVCPSSGKFSS